MQLVDLARICSDVFGQRGGDGSQEATGAVGHIKGWPINGDGQKTLFVARQGGPYGSETVTTKKYEIKTVNLMFDGNPVAAVQAPWPVSSKLRYVDDCRDGVITKRKKSEWTGYHAEMIIVSRWMKLLWPALQPGQIGPKEFETATLAFKTKLSGTMIVANAPCCKHCHNMLVKIGVQHPAPATDAFGQAVLKASLTAWWNPFTDVCVPQGDGDFANAIPGKA